MESINLRGDIKLYVENKKINQKLFGIKINYGSKYDGTCLNDKIFLPLGTAHCMEHMVFYKSEGHKGNEFIKFGAYANAITSYDSTIFYSTINENMFKIMSLLLDIVFSKSCLEKFLDIEKKSFLMR